jgi:hypothetical protein
MLPDRIVIEEQGRPVPQPRPVPSAVDLQDYLLMGGIVTGEGACIAIWWPAALILAALFCFTFAWLIERSKVKS